MITKLIQTILTAIEGVGGKPFFVGGCVRDPFLGLESKDTDVEVYGIDSDTLVDVLKTFGAVSLVGSSFGVIKLSTTEGGLDFSLPRRESKEGRGYKGFSVTVDPELSPREASLRRDFTINAMMMDSRNQVVDFFGGENDIHNKILRAVSAKFAEDPLRVLRGMQFAARFDMKMDCETIELSKSLKDEFSTLAKERIWEEWKKWAEKSTVPSKGLELLRETEWLEHFPELHALVGLQQDPGHHPEGPVFEHTMHVCDAAAVIATRENLSTDDRVVLMFAALCHDLGKAVTTVFEDGKWRSPGHAKESVALTKSFLKSIGAPERLIEKVTPLVFDHMFLYNEVSFRTIRRLALRLAPSTIEMLLFVVEADCSGRPPLEKGLPAEAKTVLDLARELNLQNEAPKPLIQGRHLIEWAREGILPNIFLKGGPHFAQMLQNMFELQLEGVISSDKEDKKLSGKDLLDIGFKPSKAVGIAIKLTEKLDITDAAKLGLLSEVLANPTLFLETGMSALAEALIQPKAPEIIALREEPVPFTVYGKDNIEAGAFDQMNIACRLPISVQGSMLPDSHQGYGLNIGGVLATDGVVIPYGIGVDIGCRMALTIYDIKPSYLKGQRDKLRNALLECTRFGAGIGFDNPMDHEVLERIEFKEIPLLKGLHKRAIDQIGSSGSGNHFVEFGLVDITDQENEFGLPIGQYIGILSHSGSRGLGANIANHYTKIAMDKCPLPKEAKNLAWLDLNTEEGQEYWLAMNLAGDYASACHEQIHYRLAKYMKWNEVGRVENHHNFAWKETLTDGREVIVHRKGATPAGKGVLGVIPGSMATPGFIVRGKGNADSINSASHGAGRSMSRTQALKSFTKHAFTKVLKEANVELIGGDLDESPMAYKNIDNVMRSQRDLVDVIGIFMPQVVRMDDTDGGDI